MPLDLLERLAVDPGQRTLGQLLQEREWARGEIRRLRRELAERARDPNAGGAAIVAKRKLRTPRTAPAPAESFGGAPVDRFLRLGNVCELVGVGRSTLCAWIAKGTFPKQVRLGARVVGWRLADIVEWQAALRSG